MLKLSAKPSRSCDLQLQLLQHGKMFWKIRETDRQRPNETKKKCQSIKLNLNAKENEKLCCDAMKLFHPESVRRNSFIHQPTNQPPFAYKFDRFTVQ